MRKNYKQFVMTVLGIIMLSITANAQIKITGQVTESNGSTLPGVNVVVKGTTQGTITDINGNYTINVPNNNTTLVFSFIGYVSEEVLVGDKTTVNVTLMPDLKTLSDVIVIGYGTMKKEDKTGAVAQVKAEELNGGVITDAVQAMQGKASGVIISKNGGDPNSSFAIQVRGASGFDSNTQPLFVIDGIPGVDPNTISPEDIATFDILKDAASTAIYGSQGANGVIIITTKKGTQNNNENKFINTVNVNTKFSIDYIAKKYDLLSANQIRQHAQNLLSDSVALHPSYTIDSIFTDGGANTDWQDEVFRMGTSNTANLNFSGGNKNSNYYASIAHSKWDGIMKGTSKERTNAKVNITHKGINDRLTINGSLSASFENNDYENYSGFGKDDIIYQMLQRNPTDPVYNADGTYNQSNRVFNYENPLAVINNIKNDKIGKNILGSVKTDFEVTKEFNVSANVAYNTFDNVYSYFRPANIYATADNGSVSKSFNNNTNKTLELTGHYKKTINKNNITLLGGYSYQNKEYDGFKVGGDDIQSDYVGYNNLSSANNFDRDMIGSYKGESKLIGFFGRAQYNYDSKYFFTTTIRRDGSSKFGANKKWGWFPTFAAGWKVNKESFMQNISWVDLLKLRASYGIAGNQEIGDYRSLQAWEISGTTINPSTGKPVISYSPAWNANPNLQWEQTAEVNIGIDFAFFNNRISGSLEVYDKKTTKLLKNTSVPVPPNLARTTFANSGEIDNKGIELSVTAFAIDKPNFSWKTTLNVSHNKSNFVSLGDFVNGEFIREGYLSGRGLIGEENYITAEMVGHEVGAFYLPEYVTVMNGEFIYKSVAGGYTNDLTQAKRKFVGTPSPDVTLGWNNSFKFFQNFTLDISIRSMIGNDVYNATKMFFDAPGNLTSLNGVSDALDWVPKGRTSGPQIADIYVEDGSFVRLDYISLGYEFNLDKIDWAKKIKVYVSSNNLLTLTGYSGADPEPSISGLAYGIDAFNVYPKTRTFAFGVNITF